jgi:hypothetical protein
MADSFLGSDVVHQGSLLIELPVPFGQFLKRDRI